MAQGAPKFRKGSLSRLASRAPKVGRVIKPKKASVVAAAKLQHSLTAKINKRAEEECGVRAKNSNIIRKKGDATTGSTKKSTK